MQVFYRKRLQTAGSWLWQAEKVKKQKQRGDTHASKLIALRPDPATAKKVIINCSLLKRYGFSTANKS